MGKNASPRQIAEIVRMLAEGEYDGNFAQALIERRVEVIEQIDLSPIYIAHVSYTLPSMDELKKGFDHVSDIYDGRPWKYHDSCVGIHETDGEREFVLASAPKRFLDCKIEDCIDELAVCFGKLGFRFATYVEAVAFAKSQPEFQRRHNILALGSSTRDAYRDGYILLVGLLGGTERGLDGAWVAHSLGKYGRLLLVKKSEKENEKELAA